LFQTNHLKGNQTLVFSYNDGHVVIPGMFTSIKSKGQPKSSQNIEMTIDNINWLYVINNRRRGRRNIYDRSMYVSIGHFFGIHDCPILY
jgi:hypothetical protein